MSEKNEKKKRKLYAAADAHLDTQWNWDIRDTIRDCVKNTLEQNFSIMEENPEYRFNFEGAFRYKLAKEYYPDLYEKLKEYVAKGQWCVAGSSWDACDVNVPSSEALMRQVLLGNGFFEKEFGKKSTDIFLTDCFGFSYALPSVEHHMGLNGFSTQKLEWGLGTPVLRDGKVLKPYKGEGDEVRMDIGKWKGSDGSSVFVALQPGGYGYNFDEDGRNMTPVSRRENYAEQLETNEKIAGTGKKMVYYGTGDYGGSPKPISAKMICEAVNDKDGMYEVVSATTDQIFNEFTPEEAAKLPEYEGELLIPHGYGAYTSRTINKRWNRKNELLADSAEKASVAASLYTGKEYPSEALDFAWKNFLWHQFHDDLPGTSLPRAYDFTHNDLVISLKMFADELTASAGAVARSLKTDVEGMPVVVFNPVSADVRSIAEVKTQINTPYVRVLDPQGREVPAQIKDGVVKFIADVPSVGFAVYQICESEKPSKIKTGLKVTKTTLENDKYKVTIDKNGDIASVFDKKLGKELLASPSRLQITRSESHDWPSWEIDYSAFTEEPQFVGGKPVIEIEDNGPAVVSLKITRTFNKSKFVQTVSLSDGGNRVDVACRVEWCERHSLLMATFPLTASNETADFDIGVGAITRGCSKEYPYYEYTHHQWADLTDQSGEFGVSVLNDCKYGIDKPNDSTLRLTLIHTPNWGAWTFSTQCMQDFGSNIFTYSICSHDGFRTETPAEAASLNEPLIPFAVPKHDGKRNEFSFVKTSGKEFIVKAVKKEEKGNRVIVRVQEMTGKKVENAFLEFDASILAASETNGYETDLGAASFGGKKLCFDLAPYEVKTFALTLEGTGCICGKAVSEPIALAYDKHITSANGARKSGDLFNGVSIPEEMYNEEIVCGGIAFSLGKKGKNNGMICAGQTIEIPEGTKKLYILAAANGDHTAEFLIDGKPVSVNVSDFSEHVGKWDLIGTGMNNVAKIKRDDLGAVYTHTHDAEGDRLYRFSYLFRYCFDVDGAKTFAFPNDDRIIVAAVTAVANEVNAKAGRDLYDNTDAPTHKLTVITEAGTTVREVAAGKMPAIEAPTLSENGKAFAGWDNGDFIFDDDGRAVLLMPDSDLTITEKTVDFSVDVCKNKPCRTNTVGNFTGNPANALDGTGEHRWETELDENGEAALEVLLRGEYTISRWLVENSGAHMGYDVNTRAFRLEYRMNREEEWKVADAVTDNTASLCIREFAPVKARMVRLVVTEPSTYEKDKTVRIYRFSVC